MNSRLLTVIGHIQDLNEISGEDHARAHLKAYIERLRRRASFLTSGINSALHGGVCATLLLAIMFTTGSLGFKHAYRAGLLFIIATAFLGLALIHFAQEARISITEYDEFR
jgi:hypothetical protein